MRVNHEPAQAGVGKPALVIVGPFPPPFGGVANITAQLASSALNETFRIQTLNICLPSEKTENTGDRPVNAWKSLRVIVQVLRQAAREHAEAVLVVMSGDISCFREMVVTLIYRVLTRARVVVHFHGRAKERSSWRAFPFMRDRMTRFPDRLVLNAVFAFTHGIVFLSPVLKEQFRGALNAKNWSKSTWVENFVVTSRFGSRGPNSSGRQTILFVGRLSKAKGFHDLLRAVPAVIARYPDAVFSCCGAPETPDALNAVQAAIDEYRGKGWLLLHGIVQGARKFELFAEADVMVYPSHFDMFPVTILEALAQGLPIVTTPVGVIPAILREPENALFVPPERPALMAEKICTLLERDDLRRTMAEANRRLALQRFDITVSAGRMCAVLQGRNPGDAMPSRD